jgi:UDP-N-acetylmuramoylalanine--D-glutamate ligase
MIQLNHFQDKTIAVLGLGKSGSAAALALKAGGAEVWAGDDHAETRTAAAAKGIPLVDLYGCDWQAPECLVLSPGIAHDKPAPHPLTVLARRAGCEIIGDMELLGRAGLKARVLGITGTNGKSTTTALIGHILAQAGRITWSGTAAWKATSPPSDAFSMARLSPKPWSSASRTRLAAASMTS